MDINIQAGQQITLHLLGEKDEALLFKTISANRQHLRRWINWVDQIQTEEDALQLIKTGIERLQTQSGLILGIFKKRALIGLLEMHDWQHILKKASIGYWLIQEEEGKGIMSLSATAFIDYLFENAGLNKIELAHLPDNSRSAALAERLGFKIEGILRDSFLMNGKYYPKVIQGLLRKEWQDK